MTAKRGNERSEARSERGIAPIKHGVMTAKRGNERSDARNERGIAPIRPRVKKIVAAAVIAVLPMSLAACNSDTNSISAQANKGDDKNYVSGDGTVTTVAPADRQKPVSFSGTLLNGQPWSSSQAAGKLLVVNVWGAWCPPCQKELPELQKAWAGWQKAGDPVQMIGLDQRDTPANAQAALTAQHVTYPSLADDGGAVLLQLQNSVTATPTTLVLDTQHRIAARVSGATTYLTLTGLVSDVLKENG